MKGFPRQSPGSLRWRLAVPAGVAVALLAVGVAFAVYFATEAIDGTTGAEEAQQPGPTPPPNAKFIPGPSDLWTAVDYTEDGSPIVADELLVKFMDDVPEEERERILSEAGAQTKKIHELSGVRLVKVDAAQREQILEELSSNENIESVGRNQIARSLAPQ
jgi:hypothetical protein